MVRLSLNVREVGRVTVIRCSGRIVAGAEAELLRDQISRLSQDHSDIVLHLGEVVFVDSSGLGMLVRLLTSTRRANGDLKLCNVAQGVHSVLQLTNLSTLFDIHESEEDAVSAFYQRRTNAPGVQSKGPAVLCVDQSADVLAYLRELLRSAGYQVLTNSNLPDSLILISATRPCLIIVGPSLRSSAATRRAFESKCATTPVVELGDEFSTLHAGQAASELLETIRVRLDHRSVAS
jgi:anti-anti-sigma factor